MHILLIDNYDSFTYNLVHYLEADGATVTVWRNDEIDFNQLDNFDGYVLSPGPGLPKNSGDLMKFITATAGKKPLLGVCLGFQALVEFYGGSIYNQEKVKHGISEKCFVEVNSKLFLEIPTEINVGLYHSWAASKVTFPKVLRITAHSKQDIIMAFEHESLPVFGVQFHPESVLTDNGKTIIRNFLKQK